MLSGLLWHRATLAKSAATKLNRMICAVNANANRAFLFLLFSLFVLLIVESTMFKREHKQKGKAYYCFGPERYGPKSFSRP